MCATLMFNWTCERQWHDSGHFTAHVVFVLHGDKAGVSESRMTRDPLPEALKDYMQTEQSILEHSMLYVPYPES